jgi:hypothetical protein
MNQALAASYDLKITTDSAYEAAALADKIYVTDHDLLKADFIESITDTGETGDLDFSLIKVFADTFTEFAYGNSIADIPDVERKALMDHLKIVYNCTCFVAPTIFKQLETDIDLVCSTAATTALESK